MAEVLIVEDTPSEASLAAIAIALRRPDTRVHEAHDLNEALNFLDFNKAPAVAILGWRALKDAPAKLAKRETAFIGFAANLTEAERSRAIEAGVRAIYERPQDWRPFCDALEGLLNDWLPVRA